MGNLILGIAGFCCSNCDASTHSHLFLPHSFRNLLSNPFNCDCRLSWLGSWLRSRRIVTGNPRCQSPAFLREIPLQDVATPDFRCDDGRVAATGFGPTAGSPDSNFLCTCPQVPPWRTAVALQGSSVPASAPAWTQWSAAATSTCRCYPGGCHAT